MTDYRHKETGDIVQAFKHDGTDEQAKVLVDWINEDGGVAEHLPKGTVDYDLHQAFLLLMQEDTRDLELVRRGFWVLRLSPGNFHSMWGDDFTELYEPVIRGG